MIIFTKYSNDRDRTLRIRTDILEEEGVLRVRKSAAHPAAADHIRGIIRHGKALSEFLAGTGFVPNACAEEDGAAVFPFLPPPPYLSLPAALLDRLSRCAAATPLLFYVIYQSLSGVRLCTALCAWRCTLCARPLSLSLCMP